MPDTVFNFPYDSIFCILNKTLDSLLHLQLGENRYVIGQGLLVVGDFGWHCDVVRTLKYLRTGVCGQMGCLSPVLRVQRPLPAELLAQEASVFISQEEKIAFHCDTGHPASTQSVLLNRTWGCSEKDLARFLPAGAEAPDSEAKSQQWCWALSTPLGKLTYLFSR